MFTCGESENRLCMSKQGQLANCDDAGVAVKWSPILQNVPFLLILSLKVPQCL